MNRKIGLLLAVALAVPLIAQNANIPIQFQAASMLINEKDNVTTLSGGAKLKRGNLDMVADVIDVYSAENAAGVSEFTHMDGRGNITAKSGKQTIKSNVMTYNAKTEIAVFTGNVSIKNGVNTAKGERAEVNIASGVHKLFGPVSGTISGGAVTGTLP